MYYSEENGRNVICETSLFYADQITDYISKLPEMVNRMDDNTKYYTMPSPTSQPISFSINTFNYKHLQGEYNDFYSLTTSDGITYTISTNETKLRGFCGWINRLTT